MQGREGLPIVYIVGAEKHTKLSHSLAHFLREADPRRVPYSLYCFSGQALRSERESVEATRAALATLAQGFGRDVNGRDGKVRFRRFGLVNWLLQQNDAGDGANSVDGHTSTLLRRLREREVHRRWVFGFLRSPQAELTVGGSVPWWLWLFCLHVIPLAWFGMRLGLGGEYRWLLRQPYLAPGDPGTFAGFAERLTGPNKDVEDIEQLRKLMVNAFLEDLRVAYRRRFWRPRAARRTSYCVALLDGTAAENGGDTLLETIIDVRIDTGTFDPLLVIACSTVVPGPDSRLRPYWGDDRLWVLDDRRYDGWRDGFLRHARARTHDSWYLPLLVPEPMEPSDPGYDFVRQKEVAQDARLRIPEPPLWARRSTGRAFVTVVALALIGVGVRHWYNGQDYQNAHCGLDSSAADSSTVQTMPTGECVGVAPYGFAFQVADVKLRNTIQTINELNRKADELHRQDPRRPLITLVHMSALFGAVDRSPQTRAYVREALQGAAGAQSRQLRKAGPIEPIVRIYPANAGSGMRYGPQVAEILAQLRKKDPTIIGVTGLDQSRDATSRTIRALTKIGLPVVGTILSADSLILQSPMYFQISPQNRREAEIAAAYAGRLRDRTGEKISPKVRVVYSDDSMDIYSGNLKDDVVKSFEAIGFATEVIPYSTPYADVSRASAGLIEIGRKACRYSGLIFFAGRAEDFESMLGGINEVCNSRPPAVLGGDDVARMAADVERRKNFPGISYDFLDFALDAARCDGTSELYAEMEQLFPDECDQVESSSLDGHAAIAFDAVRLYVNAVRQLQEEFLGMPLTPATVWHAISGVHGDKALDGESGMIDFGGDVDRQVPLDKLISVQRVDGLGRPAQVGFCGRVGGLKQSSWCPPLEAGRAR
ncbi:hypothetical protein ACFQ08_06825 [Streptosporangium algeriense]|uniref:Leucine-binding protein domain-containing protein n=1 Tax=Streptosporangium algeriense TaxID=1682748 RepID=A0ABW3DKG2_9ACTN